MSTNGPRKHMKRINAPKSWRLDKLGGKYAPNPSCGPHNKFECIPLCILLRRKLKVADSVKELKYILSKKTILVNGKVRIDKDFPLGIMDVLTIESTNEHFRVLYDTFRKFVLHKISEEEAQFRIARVVQKRVKKNATPYIYTKEGGTFRFCNPNIKKGDTVKIDIKTNQVIDYLPYTTGMRAFVTKGSNIGCVGTITSIEKHMGDHDIVYLIDSNERSFATRASNLIIIGAQQENLISLPKDEGVKISEIERSNSIYGKILTEKIEVEE